MNWPPWKIFLALRPLTFYPWKLGEEQRGGRLGRAVAVGSWVISPSTAPSSETSRAEGWDRGVSTRGLACRSGNQGQFHSEFSQILQSFWSTFRLRGNWSTFGNNKKVQTLVSADRNDLYIAKIFFKPWALKAVLKLIEIELKAMTRDLWEYIFYFLLVMDGCIIIYLPLYSCKCLHCCMKPRLWKVLFVWTTRTSSFLTAFLIVLQKQFYSCEIRYQWILLFCFL